jgi:hypothetical protein
MPNPSHADADFVRDTDPKALEIFYEIQRRRTMEHKLADDFDLSEGLFETVKSGIRLRYPAAEEHEVFRVRSPLARRLN